MLKKSDFNLKSLQHILKLIRIKDRDTTFCLGGSHNYEEGLGILVHAWKNVRWLTLTLNNSKTLLNMKEMIMS